ncbi:MAG: hypothetical protein QOH61_243 [Chloroflexota bacterium]|nr:hypothetical protein [Chloroflexota bacterium]
MVVLNCPWCQEDGPVELASLAAEFHCDSCGTSVLLAEDEESSLELAA